MKRMRTFTPWLAGFGCVVTSAVLISVLVLANRPPQGARTEQDRILAALQAFREQRGQFPDRLEETGVQFDRNVFDGVSYWKWSDGTFTLSCNKSYWSPTPRVHWWYYSSAEGVWEYETEGI